MSQNPLPTIRVTEIGEYIRHQSCERRFKLEINNRAIARELPFAERLFNSLDPVLQEVGRERENSWEESLLEAGLIDLSPEPNEGGGTNWDAFVACLQQVPVGQRAYGREIGVTGSVGAFQLSGRIDFALLLWDGDQPRLRLVECKASRRDRTYHRIQVALYRMIVRQLLAATPVLVGGLPLMPESVDSVVARIDEQTSESQPILDLEPLPLIMEEADAQQLLAADGPLARIVQTNIEDLSYQIEQKCDGCVFCVHCLPESARLRRLELIGIEPSFASALRAVGVETIDDLAALAPEGPEAAQIRQDPGFTEDLEHLVAQARSRRRSLPGGNLDPDAHDVESLPFTGRGQLPAHEIDGARLVRVYLAVDYDYSENRIGALTAHVTTSDAQIHTSFSDQGQGWRPAIGIRERIRTGEDDEGRAVYEERDVRGKDVIKPKSSEWTGDYAQDTASEREMIQDFLHELVDAIAEVAEVEEAPIHFYVWSRSEMAQLVEACSRVSSQLLGHLRELLGCREGREQLIYSTLQNEIDSRYALGWTGRGLAVVTSLSWYGRKYHWHRRVGGAPVDLSHAFTQDIFDFKTDLRMRADGTWADDDDQTAQRHKFEIRSRFHDSLTAPYWRAFWGRLPNPDDPASGLDHRSRNAIRRYNEAARPGYLREYLRARVHALRWAEEGVRFKNEEIEKPRLSIAGLRQFSLGIGNAAQAALDFLVLDQHTRVSDWIAEHLVPPANRVPRGRTIPVANVVAVDDNRLEATIDLEGFGLTLGELELRSSLGEGDFVRLSPCNVDPRHGQTIRQLLKGASTCIVDEIDWESGQVALSVLVMPESEFSLQSNPRAEGEAVVFERATLDESPTDFVASKVAARLQSGLGAGVMAWFDPQAPQVPARNPLGAAAVAQYGELLETYHLPGDFSLAADQRVAALAGLNATVQLLQGPPGTGKTATSAVAVLTRVLARLHSGNVVLISAHTHTAVDTLLERIAGLLPGFRAAAESLDLTLPALTLTKVHSSAPTATSAGGIEHFSADSCTNRVNGWRGRSVLLVGGTTSAILKMVKNLGNSARYRNLPERFQVEALVVDEASMMVFPHFLALASTVVDSGEIMLAGDHRQLSPIIAHDWENEDRPPAVIYQPFVSAFQAIRNIKDNPAVSDAAVVSSALSFTYRLPPIIRELISPLYQLDNIQLTGPAAAQPTPASQHVGLWASVWSNPSGLCLVRHSERGSRQSNAVEAEVVERILTAAPDLPPGAVAVVTPHRAQRSLLTTRLAPFMETGLVDVVDTVERLQGGERRVIIVSGTRSDPTAISKSVEFILSLNRSNVAFSRTQSRLIVVCSGSLIDHIPTEVDHYEATMLWKYLRQICSHLVAAEEIEGSSIRVLAPQPAITGTAAQ